MNFDNLEARRIGELIDGIYHGTTEPSRWPTIVTDIGDWLDAPKGLLFTPFHVFDNGGYMFSHRVPSALAELWPKWHSQDVWANIGVERNFFTEGRVLRGEDLIPHEQFLTTPVYQGFLSRFGIARLLSSIVFGADSRDLLPTVCSFYRSADDSSFTLEQVERLRLLVPHLSRALGVMVRLRDADMHLAVTRAALDMLQVGVVLFDSRGAMVHTNRRAHQLLDGEDGLRQRTRRDGSTNWTVLHADDPVTDAAIRQAITESLQPHAHTVPHFCRAITVPRPSGRGALSLQFSTLPAVNEFGHGSETPRVIVFLIDPDYKVRIDTEWLRETYALTAAELRVALLLIDGEGIEDMATALGLSANTLKTQIQHLYAKTGVDTRAKFVKLVLSVTH